MKMVSIFVIYSIYSSIYTKLLFTIKLYYRNRRLNIGLFGAMPIPGAKPDLGSVKYLTASQGSVSIRISDFNNNLKLGMNLQVVCDVSGII